MQIAEVRTPRDKKEFIEFPKRLYKGDPNWICPLDWQVRDTFEPARNPLLEKGEACRWLLKDGNNETIGRIAAFINPVRSAAYRQPTGGVGFFEVIESRVAAFTLFDTAKEWLAERNIEAMDGPVNFGENDTNWGLLVDGFMPQGFGMPYNKKYYKAFFEEYGFKNYYEQFSYHRELRNEKGEIIEFPERFMKIAEWIAKRPGYSFQHFEFRRKKKFVDDFVEIYNSTWSVFKDDFTPVKPEIIETTFRKARHVIDEELIWYAYFNDKPIAFFIIFPDLNQILRHFNGKLNFISIIRFLYYRATNEMTRMRALVAGVVPSHQNSGVESAIFLQLYKVFQKKPWYRELELSWVGDYNPKMMALYEAVGSYHAKKHVTFRYLINKELEFIRFKDEMAEKQNNNKDS